MSLLYFATSLIITMWSVASSAIAGTWGWKNTHSKSSTANPDCSDDDVSSCNSREEGLECPICWESFNIVENVPYVLWCGHTLCKNCVLGLQWAVIKFPTVPIRLPLFISCPWCNLLSFRLVYKGELTFPRKNYFLLWMVESMNGERGKSSSLCGEQQPLWPSNSSAAFGSSGFHHHSTRRAQWARPQHPHTGQNHASVRDYLNAERIHSSLRKSLAFFVHLTAKFPLLIIFLLILLYAVPASVAVLVLYILITILFAVPSLCILYFAYPTLDWLVREIFA